MTQGEGRDAARWPQVRAMIGALLGPIIGLSFTALVLETGAHLALRLLAADSRFEFERKADQLVQQTSLLRELLESQGNALVELDEELGWTYGPNRSAGPYTSGPTGARGARRYGETPPPGVLRIAAFGDSFVHGNEVGDHDVWSARLEEANPDLEILNFGVGGYGLDQALLLMRRRLQASQAQVVILGFAEVDYARSVNRYRRFLDAAELPLFKPRFALDPSGDLVLIPNPFPGARAAARLLEDPWAILEAAPHDWFFEPLVWRNPLYDRSAFVRLTSSIVSAVWRSRLQPDRLYQGDRINTDSEAFRLLVALVQRFHDEVSAQDAALLFLIFPGRDTDVWGADRTYQPLLDALPGVDRVDLADALREDPAITPVTIRAPGGHFSAQANEVVARAVAAALRRRLSTASGESGVGAGEDSESESDAGGGSAPRVEAHYPGGTPAEAPPDDPGGEGAVPGDPLGP